MILIADTPTGAAGSTREPQIVYEVPVEAASIPGQLLDEKIIRAIASLGNSVLPIAYVDPDVLKVTPSVSVLATASAQSPAQSDNSWLTAAEQIFPASRYMTQEEQTDLEDIHRSMLRPLSRVLKKLI